LAADVEHVRRASAILAFVAALVAGCGAGERDPAVSGEPAAPAAADLVGDAVEALEGVESAHYELRVTIEPDLAQAAMGTGPFGSGEPIRLRMEGDVASEAGTGNLELDLGGQTLRAELRFDADDLYVRFLGRWYGKRGVQLGDEKAKRRRGDISPHEIRAHFDEVFTGQVEAGPLVGGAETWEFRGRLNADGLAKLARAFGGEVEPDDLQALREVADAVTVAVAAGRDDRLLRRAELDIDISEDDLKALEPGADAPVGEFRAQATLELSDFGKDVQVAPPREFRPLDELVAQFFGGFGGAVSGP
jgi:hypothetical protein